ncbi:17699_t:CDS:2, partial [Gigaspora rosea]
DPPKPAKCLFKECSKPARENNPYCGESCLLHDKILEIKMTKGPDVSQKASSPPAVTETKKGHLIKSGPSQIKKMPIQQKKLSGGSGDNATKVRNLCLEKFQSLFAKKYDELSQKGELQNTQEGPEQLAQRLARRIEESIYDNFAAKTDKDGL